MKWDHERWPFPWLDMMVQLLWSDFLKKQITKPLGPSLGVNRMWIKRNDHAPKSERADFFNVSPKRAFLKKNQVWPLSCLFFGFTFIHFLFLLAFTLNFSNHDCNEGEEEKTYFALRIIHIFVHAYETCCEHSSIAFAKMMEENCNFEPGLWECKA